MWKWLSVVLVAGMVGLGTLYIPPTVSMAQQSYPLEPFQCPAGQFTYAFNPVTGGLPGWFCAVPGVAKQIATPPVTTVGDLAVWGNTNGTSLIDNGTAFPSITVANNNALKALPIPVAGTVAYRAGFTTAGDGGDATYTFATSNCTAADDGAEVQPTAGTGCWIVSAPPTGLAFAVWGTKGDGSTDDTTAFMKAVTWCDNDNGIVLLGNGRYVVNASPSITHGCGLIGPNSFTPQAPENNPSAITLPSAILLGSGDTINVQSAAVENLRVVPAALTPATSFQDALTKIAAFAGSGITISDGDNAIVRNVLIVGFNQCLASSGTHNGRLILAHIYADCTNDYLLDNAHDVDSIFGLRGWGFFNGNNGGAGGASYAMDSEPVSGIANNGSGAIRLTIGSTTNMATGNSIAVSGVGGAVGANGVWTATVIDSRHIDLQGSQFTSQSYSATLVSGQGVVTGLSSIAGIGVGAAVTGTGIPASTTVLAVDPLNNYVWLSNLATVSGSETLTFATGTYTSGGSALLDATFRGGTFVKTTNSQENHITDAFEFGWNVGYNPSAGDQWQMFHNVGCDGNTKVANICMLVDGNAFRSQFIGVNVTAGPALSYVDESTVSQGTLSRGVYLESSAPHISIILQNNNGMIDFDGRDNGARQYVANYDVGGTVRFNGLFSNTRLLNSSLPTMIGTATPTPLIVGHGSWTPQLAFSGGSSGLTCNQCLGTYSIGPDGLANFQFKVALSALGSASGFAGLIGLPIPCGTASGAQISATGIVGYFEQLANTNSVVYLNLDGVDQDEIDIRGNGSTGAARQLQNTDFTNSSELIGSLSCETR